MPVQGKVAQVQGCARGRFRTEKGSRRSLTSVRRLRKLQSQLDDNVAGSQRMRKLNTLWSQNNLDWGSWPPIQIKIK
jgi:hypothetical protein